MFSKKTQSRQYIAVFAFLLVAVTGLYAFGNKEKKPADNASGTPAPIVVRAATGGAPRPFTYVNDSGKLVGHNIELVQAIFDRLPQYKLEIEVTDFPSIFAGLDSDRYQIGVNNFAENDERKQKYIFTDPIFKNRYVAAVSASNTELGSQVKTLRDLAGKKTANSVGINVATAIENYNKATPGAPIVQSYTEADLVVVLQEVEQGKWDFNLIDKPMFEVYQREFKLNLKGIELGDDISGAIMKTPFSYLIVSKGNDKLVADINKALREIILDGTSKKINEKYFGSDYSPDAK
jgi:polar amino acid transport system substrate-binding protein